MKRMLAVLLVLCMAVTLLPFGARAAESGTCGDNVTWSVSGTTLRFSGTGRILYHGGWPSNITQVVIEDGVTTICAGAFQNCTSLQSVTIAGTVRSIGESSFAGCTALTQVWLPDSVVVIGEYAFDGCTALKDVRMGDRILSIGGYAFRNCVVETLDLPDGLLLLGSYAFYGCDMKTVVIPSTLELISGNAFAYCENLTELVIPEGVKYIHQNAFRNCTALTRVVLPASIDGGISGTFYKCENLKTVVYKGDYSGDLFNVVQQNGDGKNSYTIWYPAGNSTWTEDVFAGFKDTITWMPYEAASGGILTSDSLAEEDMSRLLEEQKTAYPEGSDCTIRNYTSNILLPDGHYLSSFNGISAFVYKLSDNLFGQLPSEGYQSMDYDKLRPGDIVYGNGMYLVVEVHEDHVVAATAAMVGEMSRYTPVWDEVLTRQELTGGNYMYLTRYQSGQTLELPNIAEPSVDESRFAAQQKTQSAPAVKRTSNSVSSGGYINPFTDVKSDRFENAILWAFYNGITTGTTSTTFSPENTCTRKQIVTFLWRYAGEPEPFFHTNPFTDVKSDRFENAILWAYYNGITTGTTSATFSPEDPCTRKQIVTFLWRYAGEPEPASMENPFTDVPVGSFYEKAILWAYYAGITTGTTSTTFSPDAPCTRKQIVTFLWRYAGEPDNKAGTAETILTTINTEIQLVVGESAQLIFTGTGSQAGYNWKSLKPGVVKVDEKGVITAVSEGTAYIQASDPDYTKTFRIDVYPAATENFATEIKTLSAGGGFYDGMTAYVGDTMELSFVTDGETAYRGVSIDSSAPGVVSVSYSDNILNSVVQSTTAELSFNTPGDTVITVTSDDGAVVDTYRIHVERYLPFDPGSDDLLLSPEEFACYVSLTFLKRGFRVSDSTSSWREGAPLLASDLTYGGAVAQGLSYDTYWNVGERNYLILNYAGDREWSGQNAYRFQISWG